MTPAEAAQYVVRALEGGAPVAEVLVVGHPQDQSITGARMIVFADDVTGSTGSAELDAAAIRIGREALVSRSAGMHRVGESDLFVEPHHPPEKLVIVGAGHIARPLCTVGALAGFQVTVLDDRPGFATQDRFPEAARLVQADFSEPFRGVKLDRGSYLVLVTRGHKYDYDALKDVLDRGLELAYVGMVGSQRRVRAALEQLVREGITPDQLENVYAPIGLDIGAETPEEIAISIVSELIRIRRGGTGESLRDRARVLDRWIRKDRGS